MPGRAPFPNVGNGTVHFAVFYIMVTIHTEEKHFTSFLKLLYNCYRFTGLLTLFQVIFRSFNAYLILIFLQQTSPIKKIAVTAL